MPDDLPANRSLGLGVSADIPTDNLPLTLKIMLNAELFARVKEAATIMAQAEGFIGKHLIGKPQACFAILTRSMDWKLDPYFVGQCTYQTPNGVVGFEGKLCQAILENSGRFLGGIRFEHHGDWATLTGKFKKLLNAKGNEVVERTWTDADEVGLGVTVIGQVRGEPEPRRWSFELSQAYPRNSPLWVTDPRSQICYLAVRRFGDLAAPGIYGGVRFNVDEFLDASERARDVTGETLQTADPEPSRDTRTVVDAQVEEDASWEAFDAEGECVAFKTAEGFYDAVLLILADAAKRGITVLRTAYSNNVAMMKHLHPETVRNIERHAKDLADDLLKKAADDAQKPAETANAGALVGGETAAAIVVAQAQNDAQAASTEAPDPTAVAATSDTLQHGPSGGSGEPGNGAGNGPTATTAASPSDSFWDGPSLEIKVPTRPKGSTNWPAYAEMLTKMVNTAPSFERIQTFRKDNERHIAGLRISYAGGATEFEDAAKAREAAI